MKFPGTKKEFDKWWRGKTDDRVDLPRAQTCPIARFLCHKGVQDPRVRITKWSDNDKPDDVYDIPVWAQKYVRSFDTKL